MFLEFHCKNRIDYVSKSGTVIKNLKICEIIIGVSNFETVSVYFCGDIFYITFIFMHEVLKKRTKFSFF